MKNTLLLILGMIFSQLFVNGQATYLANENMSNDSIEFSISNIGILWYDATQGGGSYHYPAGTTKSPFFVSNIWLSGITTANDTLVAANNFNQFGNDYFPGPLDAATGTIDSLNLGPWNYIWKITRDELEDFYAAFGGANFDIWDNQWVNIRSWPGYGNIMARGAAGANISADLIVNNKDESDFAPFVDVNSNGLYDLENGDYPDIKGDQMCWWIFNDAGGTKTETNSPSMHMEIAAKAYIYKHHTILDNQSFYEYQVTNRGNIAFLSFNVGTMLDGDLGFAFDDYMASDPSHSIGFQYNGAPIDGTGQGNSYGNNPPIAGLYFPGLRNNMNTSGLQSITYYNNDITGPLGNPESITDYYNYLQGLNRMGLPYTDNCNTTGVGTPTKFVYEVTGDSTECECSNPPGDRRIVLTAQPLSLDAGETMHLKQVAIIRNQHLDCSETNPWQEVYDTITSEIIDPPLAINTQSGQSLFSLYPTPTQNLLEVHTISTLDLSNAQVSIKNIIGQEVESRIVNSSQELIKLDVSHLRSGVYVFILTDGEKQYSTQFVKK